MGTARSQSSVCAKAQKAGMRVEALEAFGIDEQVIELWKSAGHERLLPVQVAAIRKCGVLNGDNVLVFSPTSSGKTFVGEVAAIRTAKLNRRTIYLVPQKALAEEKYNDFRRKYASFGIRTVISSRDRREHDVDIHRGQFHIAIVVFEKMQGLLVANPGLLRNVGLVVVDELQMIGDENRGPGLEVLLTKIRLSEGDPQVIGLSAVLGNSKRLAEWLGAKLCRSESRPVELRRGVLCDGVFRYAEHNSGKEGAEKLGAGDDDGDGLVAQVRRFVESGEQCLVFCKAKKDCVSAAAAIAKVLRAKPAAGALADLHDLEDSRGKDNLTRLLEHGAAYHNADLDWDQRDLIERWFRRGEIAVICATSTLAMGINLPAKNVFLDPERWNVDRVGGWGRVPITQGQYENTSGRAGRLGLEDEFGRAIIATASEFQANTYYDTYVKGELGDVEPALARAPLAHHIVNLVASKICRTDEQIREVMLASYTGQIHWSGGERQEEFQESLAEALDGCLEGGLLERKKGELTATDLGKLAAMKGIAVDTAIQMARFARKHKDAADDLHLLEILLLLMATDDGQRLHFNLSTQEHQSGEYLHMIQRMVRDLPAAPRDRLSKVLKITRLDYDETKRAKKTMLLYHWTQDIPTRDVELKFHCFTGSILGLAHECSWLADAFSSVATICDWPEEAAQWLSGLPGQLVHGIPERAVEIAAAQVRGLGRNRMVGLLQSGLDTLEKIVEAPRKQLEKLLTATVARRVLGRIKTIFRRKQAQQDMEEVPESLGAGETGDTPDGEIEWAEEYPASDDMGAAYQSDVEIRIDGRARKRHYLVRLDDREAWLTEKSFAAALKLAVAATTTELGWISGLEMGEPDAYHQVIRRLKQGITPAGVDADSLVENNGAKQYRFSVPPRNIKIDVDMIRRHLSEHGGLLDAYQTHLGELV